VVVAAGEKLTPLNQGITLGVIVVVPTEDSIALHERARSFFDGAVGVRP